MRPIAFILPVKALDRAKSRLAGAVGDDERRRLVMTMYHHVLSCALGSGATRVVVMTRDERVGKAGSEAGADWVVDSGSSLNASLQALFDACWNENQTPCYLPADLPFLQPEDLTDLLERASEPERVVASPSLDGLGTNALLVPPAGRLTLSLGPGSFARHLARASEHGLRTAIVRRPGLGFDLDTVADLRRYRASAVLPEVS